jgi:hypothetical protein
VKFLIEGLGKFLQGAEFGLSVARFQTSDCRLRSADPFTKLALAHPRADSKLLDELTEVDILGRIRSGTRPADAALRASLIHSFDAMSFRDSGLLDTPEIFKVCVDDSSALNNCA